MCGLYPYGAELARRCLDKEKGTSGEATSETKQQKKKKKKAKSTDENDDPLKASAEQSQQKTRASDSTNLESSDSTKIETSQQQKPETSAGTTSKSTDRCDILKSDACKDSDLLVTESDPSQNSDIGNIDKSVTGKACDSVDDDSAKGGASRGELSVTMETADVTQRGSKLVMDKSEVVKETIDKKEKDDSSSVLGETKLDEPESQALLQSKTADCAVGNVGVAFDATDQPATLQDSVAISCDSAKPVMVDRDGREEPVTKEEAEVAKEVVGDYGARRKLHSCGLCGRQEVSAKTFKRCQK